MATANSEMPETDTTAQNTSSNPILITCPVCQEDYEEPKLLPCAHRLCRKCLVTWIKSNTGAPSCPVCYRHITQEIKGISLTNDSTCARRKSYQTSSKQDATAAAQNSQKASPSSATQQLLHIPPSSQDACTTLENSSISAARLADVQFARQLLPKTPSVAQDVSPKLNRANVSVADKKASPDTGNGLSMKNVNKTQMNADNDEKNAKTEPEEKTAIKSKEDGAANAAADDVIEHMVDNLPTDMVLAAVVECTDKLRSPHICTVCQGNKMATDFCMFCEDKLCELCAQHHSRMTITRHHELQPLDKLTPVHLASTRRERCPRHPDQFLELYCPVHHQTTCLSCYPVRHGGCGAIETASDAAAHQRQVVQKQMDKLIQASNQTQRRRRELTESQQQAKKDVTALVTRLSTFLREFEYEMMTKISSVPENAGLHSANAEVNEWNWQTAAHQQLVNTTLTSANDVNMLHLSGALAARAARLAAGAPKPRDSSRVQLMVAEESVLEVERKIRALVKLETPFSEVMEELSSKDVIPEKPTAEATMHFWSPKPSPLVVSVKESSNSGADFNPFQWDCRLYASPDALQHEHISAMCLVDTESLAFTRGRAVNIMGTREPYTIRTVFNLPQDCRAMALLEDGVVAMTTESNVIYFLNIKKKPMTVEKVHTKKGYWGIAPGPNDKLIVSFDGTPPSVDVITRQGRLVKTLAPVTHGEFHNIGRPHHVCRWGDYFVVADSENNRLLRISCDAGAADTTESGFLWMNPPEINRLGEITTDHAGRLYVSNFDSRLLLTDTGKRWTEIPVRTMGNVAVSREGKVFISAGCGPEIVQVYNFTKPAADGSTRPASSLRN